MCMCMHMHAHVCKYVHVHFEMKVCVSQVFPAEFLSLQSYIFLDLFILYIHVYLHVYICTMFMQCLWR